MKFIFFLILIYISLLNADLPIHCLKSQTVGKWRFYLSPPTKSISPSENTCGHETPDNEKTSYQAKVENFKVHSVVTFKFHEDGCIEHIKGGLRLFRFKSNLKKKINHNSETKICENGPSSSWTMIYDEGFEIRFKDYRLLAFQNYFPTNENPQKYKSNCSKTLMGWYYSENKGMGCFWGEMIEKKPNVNYINDQLSQLVVVENKVEEKKFIFKEKKKISNDRSNYLKIARFKSSAQEKLKFSSQFKDHSKIIDRLNQHSHKTWTATLHPEFKFLSILELNRLAGRMKNSKSKFNNEEYEAKGTMKFKNKFSSLRIKRENISDLPKSFSWKQYLSEPGQQGSCGSCYAISTLKMIEARIRIQYNISLELSQDYVLNCAYYNQGCDGGYSVLVSKFGLENFLIEKTCKYNKNNQGVCDISNCTNSQKFKIKDYWYIGGNYGGCSERKMMEEIMKNGPIVVSFEPDYTFMLYGKGIYHSPKENSWLFKGENKPEWYKVDHSVVCYGWGEENGEEYWLLMNSWGKNWGENGHFRMRKGVDELGIEFIGESAIPYLPSF